MTGHWMVHDNSGAPTEPDGEFGPFSEEGAKGFAERMNASRSELLPRVVTGPYFAAPVRAVRS